MTAADTSALATAPAEPQATDSAPVAPPDAIAPTEPPPAEAPAAPDVTSRAFAALAKKERALMERERAFKAQTEREQGEIAPLREAMEAIRSGKPLDGLQKLGIDYADLTKSIIGRPKADPVEPLRAELEALKSQLTQREQAELSVAHERAVAEVRGGVEAHIRERAEDYPILSATPDGIDQVFALIQRHAAETASRGQPELLPFDEAARLVEQDARAGLEALAPVFRRLFVPDEQPKAVETTASGTTPDPTRGTERPATISNRAAAEHAPQASNTPPRTYAEIERERIRRATEALKLK